MKILIDADACPVKEETLKVAERYGLEVLIVSNGGMMIGSPTTHKQTILWSRKTFRWQHARWKQMRMLWGLPARCLISRQLAWRWRCGN